ncbi:hypothetical protein G9409_01095 [Chlorobium sp. BLA1]|uniref:LIC12162 family transferase n=1 Tax=Candidatus Chlorobium masyuteum TaxID=2716876 RepID=UPI00141EEED0|nr:LIC12162 family protein [Candidatus Chlorobium masyuteum]NHQ59197.1 hypothetical protein [Candidatus Chlorobium masyuteum]
MFLATTSTREFWNPSGKLIYLGEWCLLYSEKKQKKSFDSDIIPFYWDSGSKTEVAIRYCQLILEKLYTELTRVLNSYHGVDYEIKYYKLLLGTWPFHFIHQLYDKYIHLKTAIALYPDLHTWSLDKDQHYIPVDPIDYFKVLLTGNDDRYQLQIYSDLLILMEIQYSNKKLLNPLLQKSRYQRTIKKYSKSNIYRIISGRISKLHTFCLSDVPLTFFQMISLFIRMRGNILVDNFNYDIDISCKPDLQYRKEIKLEMNGDHFESLLSSIILKHLPIIYLEGYKELHAQVFQKEDRNPSSFLTSQIAGNVCRSIYVAEKYKIMNIYSLQHGGGYGVDKLNPSEMYERDVSDLFFTSGWVDDEKTKPLSIPIFKNKSYNIKQRKDILFCINDLPRYVFRFHYVPMGAAAMNNYLADSIRFLSALNNKSRIIIRIYPDDNRFGNCTKERVDYEHPGLRYDSSRRSFLTALKYSRLFVSNYFNTASLEALANNIPTVVFLDKEIFAFSDHAMPFISMLYSVGILHETPASAAAFIDKNYADIMSWWESASVQKARISFVNKYASCVDNWQQEWHGVIERNIVAKKI